MIIVIYEIIEMVDWGVGVATRINGISLKFKPKSIHWQQLSSNGLIYLSQNRQTLVRDLDEPQ